MLEIQKHVVVHHSRGPNELNGRNVVYASGFPIHVHSRVKWEHVSHIEYRKTLRTAHIRDAQSIEGWGVRGVLISMSFRGLLTGRH